MNPPNEYNEHRSLIDRFLRRGSAAAFAGIIAVRPPEEPPVELSEVLAPATTEQVVEDYHLAPPPKPKPQGKGYIVPSWKNRRS